MPGCSMEAHCGLLRKLKGQHTCVCISLYVHIRTCTQAHTSTTWIPDVFKQAFLLHWPWARGSCQNPSCLGTHGIGLVAQPLLAFRRNIPSSFHAASWGLLVQHRRQLMNLGCKWMCQHSWIETWERRASPGATIQSGIQLSCDLGLARIPYDLGHWVPKYRSFLLSLENARAVRMSGSEIVGRWPFCIGISQTVPFL